MLEILEKIRTAINTGATSTEIRASYNNVNDYRAFFEPRIKYFTKDIVVRYWCDTTWCALVEWSDRWQALNEINEQISSYERIETSIASGHIKPKCVYCGSEAYTGLYEAECGCIEGYKVKYD